MSLTGATIMAVHPHNRSEEAVGFGVALAGVLAKRYPVFTAKMVARDLSASGVECTLRTAENILQGHLSNPTITRLFNTYGIGIFLEAAGAMRGRSPGEIIEDFIIENAEQARKEQAAARERWREYRNQLRLVRDSAKGFSGVNAASKMGELLESTSGNRADNRMAP